MVYQSAAGMASVSRYELRVAMPLPQVLHRTQPGD
jgi:hypothetical protein